MLMGVENGLRHFRRLLICFFAFCLTAVLLISGLADGPVPALTGEWVFRDLPDNTVIVLNEDGTARYGGQDLVWQDTDSGLLLTDSAGAALTLRYELSETGMTLWLPSVYERISEIGGEGEIIGTWKAVGGVSQSSFVFTEDGQFLEDGVFSGHYTADAGSGFVLLQYSADFQDTGIYCTFTDEGYLYVAYPWKLIRK